MAVDTVESIYSEFPWLRELGNEIYQLIIQGTLEDIPAAILVSRIRESEPYKVRFAGMSERERNGWTKITERAYLDLESDLLGQVQDTGLLPFLATNLQEQRDLAARWIGGDVSSAEMSRRIDRGFAAVADSGEQVRRAFNDFYGYQPDDQTLLLYFLEPDRGLREIENQVAAVTVGGAAYQYGLNITRTRAEMLAKSGVTGDMARSGFADVATETPLLERLAKIHAINPLSQQDIEEFVFHEDPNIAARRRRIFDTALADFRGGSFGAGTSSPLTNRGGFSELVDIRRTV